MQLASVLFLCASSMRIVSGADWCYQSEFACNYTCTGPQVWGDVSQYCGGRAQSPTNIVTRKTLLDKRLAPFRFIGYQDTFHAHLSNNGHGVQMDLPFSVRIEGGNLTVPYKALELHLHWGKDGGPGSEHTIDGERFPMEMHIVHIKEEYNSLSEAVRDHTGVAVLGFFFQESKSANKKFEPLIQALKYITRPTNSTTLSGVSLESFILPQKNMTKYFQYDGSLTTPNCAESVIWNLFENPIHLSNIQLAAFSHLKFPNGKDMVNTYRPLQPLNGRQVYYSGGHVAVVSSVLLVMSVLASGSLCMHITGRQLCLI